MLSFSQKLDRLKAIDMNAIFLKVMENSDIQAQIVYLNQNQLLTGIGAGGESLPRYVDDPYFKTEKAAKAYQKWKEDISPNTTKDPEVMDYYITGKLQSSIKVELKAKSAVLSSDSPIADDAQATTDDNFLGLNQNSIDALRPVFNELFFQEYNNQVNIIMNGN